MASKDLRYKNLAVIDPLFSPPINACDWLALNVLTDTGQSVSPTIVDGGSHAYASQSTKAHAKFTSSGTSVSITTSFSNFFSLDNGVSILDADLVLLDSDYTLIQQLLDGSLTTGLSFSASNVKHYYPCTDNDSLEFIQDTATAGLDGIDKMSSGVPQGGSGWTDNGDGTFTGVDADGYIATLLSAGNKTANPMLTSIEIVSVTSGSIYDIAYVGENMLTLSCIQRRIYKR